MKKLFGLAILWTLIWWWITFAGTWCVVGGTCSTTTTVQVTLTGWTICIGSSGVFNFGSFAVSSIAQTVTGAFATGYFFVDDMKGADSGYYTTVQMSGHLVWTGWVVISGSNVYMQTAATPTLLAGRANPRVEIHAAMTGYQSLDTARTLIFRSAANNQGFLSMYGVLPLMQLVIPAYQSVGTYIGILVYTLYEN